MVFSVVIGVYNCRSDSGYEPPTAREVRWTHTPALLFDTAVFITLIILGILSAAYVIRLPPAGYYTLSIGGIVAGVLIPIWDFHCFTKAKY